MKTIVMTGATSGLGKFAARKIAQGPDTRLIVGARSGGSPRNIETLPLDLGRLSEVRAFAQTVTDRLGATQIDVLVLNAGTQFVSLDQRTEDGFETTFAVNHLAHYLLLRLLLPKLSREAVVVITTSNTHDSASNPMAPKQLAHQQWGHPSAADEALPKAGFRAYTSSKLCNLLTTRGLAALPEAKALNLRVIAYNPGLTPGTSLFRDWPLRTRIEMRLKLLNPKSRINTVALAGNALANLALGRTTPSPGRMYASLVNRHLTWPDPSELVRNDDAMNILWRDSAAMVELSD